MTKYAIMRVEKRKDIGSIRRCAEHHLRAVPTPNADPSRSIRVLAGSPDAYQVTSIISSVVAPLVKRKDATRCLDVFCGASPAFFDEGGSIADFERLVMKWAGDTFGVDNIMLAVTHEDESTPHVQLLVLPINDKGRLSASHWIDGPKKLRKLQNSFAETMSVLGLSRGVEGSKATHEAVKHWYGDLKPKMEAAQQVIDQAEEIKANQVARERAIAAKSVSVESEKLRLASIARKLDQRAVELDEKATFLERLGAELQRQKQALLDVFDKLPLGIQATLAKVFGKAKSPAPAPAVQVREEPQSGEKDLKPANGTRPYLRRPA